MARRTIAKGRDLSLLRRAAVVVGVTAGVALGTAVPVEALAPDRGYELVSPSETFGQGTTPRALSPDGSRVLTQSGGGYADTPSQDGLANNYVALRSSNGWLNQALNLPASIYRLPGFWWDATDDLSEHLVLSAARDELTPSGHAFYFVDEAGRRRKASPSFQNRSRSDDPAGFLTYVGASADLDRFVFTAIASRPVLPTDVAEGTNASNRAIYEVYDARSDEPKARRVDLDNDGNVMGQLCGRTPGGERSLVNVISHDGRTIFFGSRTPPVAGVCAAASRGPVKLFARVDGSSTVEVSASECDRVPDPGADPPVPACAVVPANAPAASDAQFLGASSDGSTAIFSTNRQLTNSDTDTTDDLYEYRRNPPAGEGHLTQITAAPGQSATPGSGARHLGVLRISDDGQRVYFVAQGVLSTNAGANGSVASDGANNLYVFERTTAMPDGQITFIARLASSGDAALWGSDMPAKPVQMADASGRFLVLNSTAQLTSDDTDAVSDVYRYDADNHALIRVSQAKAGFGSNGNGAHAARIRTPFANYFSRVTVRSISADGAGVVFQTDEALQVDDVNDAADVYEWREGSGVELVSDGTSTVALGQLAESITPDGGSIMFSTASRLTPDDIDGANDAYVARKGGGFVFPAPQPHDICEGDDCQPMTPAPEPPVPPATPTYNGPGNVLTEVPQPGAKPRISVRGASRARARSVRLTVKTSKAGVVRISGSGIRSVRKRFSGARTHKLTVRLSARGSRSLARRGRVSVTARVRLQTSSGDAVTTTKRVLFLRRTGGAR